MTVLDRLEGQLWLDDTERMLLDSVKRLARESFAPAASEYDRSGAFPWANIRALNELGLNAMFVPESYGGAELGFKAYLACVQEISRACASTGIIWATNFHAMKPLITYGNEEQKARLLPRIASGGLASLAITEPGCGLRRTGMKTSFRPDGDHIVVDGGKCFINNETLPTCTAVRKWSEIDDPKNAISVLIHEKGTPGLSVLGIEDKMGTQGIPAPPRWPSKAVVCRGNNLLGKPGDGLAILLRFTQPIPAERGSARTGIARGAFDRAVAYANQRRHRGRRVIDNQGIQFIAGDMATELALVTTGSGTSPISRVRRRGLRYRVLDAEDEGFDLAMQFPRTRSRSTAATFTAAITKWSALCATRRSTQIWEGTNQIHRHTDRTLVRRKESR